MAKLSNRLRYQLNQMSQMNVILSNKKKPLSSKANQRDIDHKQALPISFSNFQSRPLRPVLIDLQMFLNTKQMEMPSPKNRHGLTGNFQSKSRRQLRNKKLSVQRKDILILLSAKERQSVRWSKERQSVRWSKLTSSFVPDYSCADTETKAKFAGVGAYSVTLDHWADVNTSKAYVRDVLDPYSGDSGVTNTVDDLD